MHSAMVLLAAAFVVVECRAARHPLALMGTLHSTTFSLVGLGLGCRPSSTVAATVCVSTQCWPEFVYVAAVRDTTRPAEPRRGLCCTLT